MTKEGKNKLKDEYQKLDFDNNDIPDLTDKKFLKDGNKKYMKMYNRISFGYDFAENIMGKKAKQMRGAMMKKLEWKDNISVLYVSIGTGRDLRFTPKNIDLKSLTICGIDISLGMLKRCRKNFNKKNNLSLFNCCAEKLPFRDNSFDIVFHVGGINFFEDKTKLLTADETNDLVEKHYKKIVLQKIL